MSSQVHIHASVSQQFNLILAIGWRCSVAGSPVWIRDARVWTFKR